jgi:hypothetical protein
MATLDATHCPICQQRAQKLAKNNYMLCTVHGWFDPGIVFIDIQRAAPARVTAQSIKH